MTTVMAAVLSLLLATPCGAQVQDPRPPEDRPGIVRGTITSAATGKPLRRARVRLLAVAGGARSGPQLTANTNASGRFQIRNVPPSSYYLSAERAGYIRAEYGQRNALERGLPVDIAKAQEIGRMDLALPPGGVLAGRITDELGEPYPGVQITALMWRYDAGKRVPSPSGGATTDDAGQFRIAGLAPGHYNVVAISNETWRNNQKETWGYASTYYPGGTHDMAKPITLTTSEQRTDVDLALYATRTATVRGRVVRSDGEAVAAAQVGLMYSFPGFVMTYGRRSVRTAGDGSFQFSDVPGGAYLVGGGSADQRITVSGADIDDIVLTPRTGSTVLGSVSTDEGVAPPFPTSGVRILLQTSSDDVLPTVRVVQVDTDWSFKLQSLGGPFLFRVTGVPDDWTLAAVRLDNKDITDIEYNVPIGGKEIRGLEVVLTRKIGRVSGTVTDATGKPTSQATVVVFSEEPDHWRPYSRYVQATRPASDGRFSLKGLPPGTYRAIVRDFIEQGQWEDRQFLESMRDDGIRFVLADGGTEMLTLRLERQR